MIASVPRSYRLPPDMLSRIQALLPQFGNESDVVRAALQLGLALLERHQHCPTCGQDTALPVQK